MEQDSRDQAGAVACYLFKLDKNPNEMLMVAVFNDKATYTKSAGDPEQDKWYQKLRAALSADPVLEDGEVVAGDAIGK